MSLKSLPALAVRSLFEGFCRSIGFEAGAAASEAAVKFLGSRFTDHSAKMSEALERATTNAWRALELALAGDSWWDRVKVALSSREDQAFREQVTAFLRTTPLANLPAHPPEFRTEALRQLRDARKAGHLMVGALDGAALAREAGPFAKYAEPQALLDAEWALIEQMITQLRYAGYPALAHFLGLRPQNEMPLVVVAVRYFFRREIEEDQQLATALSFARMEQIAFGQEAGFDALRTVIDKTGSKLEEMLDGALTILTKTHETVLKTATDVQDIKSALDRQGQHLELMGQTMFRAVTIHGQGAQEPARPEQDVRLEILNTLLTTPHRQLNLIWPVHQQLIAKDPRFYVRLGAWYFDKGEVRDHKEMFIVNLALSAFDGHRDVALALLGKLPPYQVMRVVDFIHGRKETKVVIGPDKKAKREVTGEFGLFRNVPRSLKSEVTRYLREREANPEWFDSTVLIARKALKRLYTVLHIKPGERAQAVLFDDQPPADSRLSALKKLSKIDQPDEQARAIIAAKLPFRIAVSVLPAITPPLLEALITGMSPQDVINNLALLQRHGALGDPELKTLVELKLEAAKTSKRVSSFKADKAAATVDVGEDIQRKLAEVTDVQIKARGRVRRSTALLVDKSGSMDVCIDVGKRIAAMISAICEKELYVYAFDKMAYPIESKGTDWASWKKAFEGINANGETSAGSAVEMLRRRQQRVEQIIVVTDEEEYDPPFFVESLLKYRQALSVDPSVCFIKVPDSSTRLETQCKRAGIATTAFQFNGDYYSLPNLVSMVEPPSELDLLMEIMDYPLPAR